MRTKKYKGPEQRKFARFDYTAPLDYKVCKKKTISRLVRGYTVNISQGGLRCKIKDKVKKNDILWLAFDRATLMLCQEIDKRSLIYQNGIIGKVIWVKRKRGNAYDVGIQFITREEKNLTHIYPRAYFLNKQRKGFVVQEEEELEEESGAGPSLQPEAIEEQEER